MTTTNTLTAKQIAHIDFLIRGRNVIIADLTAARRECADQGDTDGAEYYRDSIRLATKSRDRLYAQLEAASAVEEDLAGVVAPVAAVVASVAVVAPAAVAPTLSQLADALADAQEYAGTGYLDLTDANSTEAEIEAVQAEADERCEAAQAAFDDAHVAAMTAELEAA
jgi:hypothetical protein